VVFFERLKQGLKGVRERWSGGLSRLFSGSVVDEAFWDNLEEILISGDVGIDLTLRLIDSLKKESAEKRISRPEDLFRLFEDTISSQLLAVPSMGQPLSIAHPRPVIILLVGVTAAEKQQRQENSLPGGRKKGKRSFSQQQTHSVPRPSSS